MTLWFMWDLHFQVGRNLLIPSSVYLSSFNRNVVFACSFTHSGALCLHAVDHTSAVYLHPKVLITIFHIYMNGLEYSLSNLKRISQ